MIQRSLLGIRGVPTCGRRALILVIQAIIALVLGAAQGIIHRIAIINSKGLTMGSGDTILVLGTGVFELATKAGRQYLAARDCKAA